jgi:hypothetical protein
LKIKNKKKNGDKRSKGTKEKIFSIHKEENGPPKKKHSLSNSKIAFPDISIKNLISGNQEPKKENKKKAKRINNNKVNINIIPINNFNYKKRNKRISRVENRKKTTSKKMKINKTLNNNINPTIKAEDKRNYLFQNLNDQELNSLEYKSAIQIDKRTYFQYYWALLKKKNILLFTFYPSNDYNLTTIKICLLLTSFSLHMTIHGFFFSDETMHDIHINYGSLPFTKQIPYLLYTSVITSVINMILRNISLSEKSIIDMKANSQKNMKSEKITFFSNLKIKYIVFFISSYLLLLFFWYFISCFCAVYINTQIILIRYAFISFCTTMIYQFGLCLIPGIFRISSLRSANKNLNACYNISNLIALLI